MRARHNRRRLLVLVSLITVVLAACGDEQEATQGQPQTATAVGARADVVNAQNQPLGEVTFTEQGRKIMVEATLRGLPPGWHGFHIHASGKCEPPFASAGGHMTVGDQAHPSHAGDQPMLLVLADGTADLRFSTDRYTLSDLLSPEGRAVIVHTAPDNYAHVPTRYVPAVDDMTIRTGDAGDRIACGVIRRP